MKKDDRGEKDNFSMCEIDVALIEDDKYWSYVQGLVLKKKLKMTMSQGGCFENDKCGNESCLND